MLRICLTAICLSLATPVLADEPLPPGLASARLLPGWTTPDGARISALELQLQPGWKTYWRMPGDSGMPPSFDWQGAENLASVVWHWPAPEAIRSGDEVTLGYHDRLVLPLTATPEDPSKPVELAVAVELGLCERICVPVAMTLTAPAPLALADPAIEAALADGPDISDHRPVCRIEDIRDGVRVSAYMPQTGASAVALELDGQPEVWVSSATLQATAQGTTARADFVPPSGKPFDLDPQRVRVTVLSDGGAVEMTGCATP